MLIIELLKLMPYKWRMKLDHSLYVVAVEEEWRLNDLKRFDIPKDILNWQKEQDEKSKR